MLRVFARHEYVSCHHFEKAIFFNRVKIFRLLETSMHKWETFKVQARQYLLTKEWHKAGISTTYVILSVPLKTSGR